MFPKTLFLTWILLLLICGSVSERMWDFEVVSVASYSGNESLLNISVSVQQVSRGEISVTAVLDWRFDADERTMIEGQSYSCYSGNEKDFRLMPYKINKMKLFDFFDTFYSSIVYQNIEKCSNFPDFKDGFKPPLPQDTYKLENCLFTGEGFPEVLPASYYRIVFLFSGQADGSLTYTFKVINKNQLVA